MAYFIWLALGYLLGSIPFAVLIARARGVDIFKVGSGNPGATNVVRSVGPWAGRLCFALDALKGFVPVILARLLADDSGLACAALAGALVGHSFPVWTRFRGGKGVATSVGALFAFVPMVMVGALLLWGAVFSGFRFVSLASVVMAVWLPFGAYFLGADTVSVGVVSAVGALLLVRHAPNIGRLLQGKENRFAPKKQSSSTK